MSIGRGGEAVAGAARGPVEVVPQGPGRGVPDRNRDHRNGGHAAPVGRERDAGEGPLTAVRFIRPITLEDQLGANRTKVSGTDP